MRKKKKEYDRIDYCGECCGVIDISDPSRVIHKDGTPLCPPRKPKEWSGKEIEIKPIDRRKRDRSKADPRDRNNWILHPAADGNKPWMEWKPKKDGN